MPSTISHIITGTSLGYFLYNKPTNLRFWIILIFCSIAADFDVIGFKFGVKYADFWGHRGFFHSLSFALLLAIVAAIFLNKKMPVFSAKNYWYLLFVLCTVTALHTILDGFTSGGLGMAYLSPFDNRRFFFPARPIKVSPIGIKEFFSQWGYNVLRSEAYWLWIPSGALVFVKIVSRQIKKKRPPDTTI
jgi:inner membrane protein